jgi:hypothetical protein
MEQKSTFWKSAMTYGIYLSAALILYSVVLYVMGQSTNGTLALISYVIMGGGIYWCQLNYRDKELDGYINYNKALGFGVAIMLFAGILNSVFSLVLMKLDPGILEQARITQEEAMLQQGMSDEQIEMAGEIMSKFQNPAIMMISGLLGFALIGFIISLITSIFIKKNEDENAFDEAMEDVKSED